MDERTVLAFLAGVEVRPLGRMRIVDAAKKLGLKLPKQKDG